jgi:hypothetical protein
MNLTGGVKSHTNSEGIEWTERASLAFIKDKLQSFYDKNHLFNAVTFDVAEPIADSGALTRALNRNLPVIKVWDSHDNTAGAGSKPLTPLDRSDKEKIDLERMDEEVISLLKYIYSEILDIDDEFLKYKDRDDSNIHSKPLQDSLNQLMMISLAYMYQSTSKLPISEENQEVFQEYLEDRLSSLLPSLEQDQIKQLLHN